MIPIGKYAQTQKEKEASLIFRNIKEEINNAIDFFIKYNTLECEYTYLLEEKQKQIYKHIIKIKTNLTFIAIKDINKKNKQYYDKCLNMILTINPDYLLDICKNEIQNKYTIYINDIIITLFSINEILRFVSEIDSY